MSKSTVTKNSILYVPTADCWRFLISLDLKITLVLFPGHCDDCIKHTACPEAFNINSFLETPESTFILFQGLCGYDGQTPKVPLI